MYIATYVHIRHLTFMESWWHQLDPSSSPTASSRESRVHLPAEDPAATTNSRQKHVERNTHGDQYAKGSNVILYSTYAILRQVDV
jgi:hypothetical protein